MSLDDWDGSGAAVFVAGSHEQIACTVAEPQRFDFAVIPGEFPDSEDWNPPSWPWKTPQRSPADNRAIVVAHMATMTPDQLDAFAAIACEIVPDCPGCPDI